MEADHIGLEVEFSCYENEQYTVYLVNHYGKGYMINIDPISFLDCNITEKDFANNDEFNKMCDIEDLDDDERDEWIDHIINISKHDLMDYLEEPQPQIKSARKI